MHTISKLASVLMCGYNICKHYNAVKFKKKWVFVMKMLKIEIHLFRVLKDPCTTVGILAL